MQLRWLEQSEGDLPAGDDWLSRAEAGTLAAMRFPKRRADWRLGRWTAKCAVAAVLDEPRAFSEIEIRAAPSGAPEVFCAGLPAPLAISISHRAGTSCCAVAGRPLELGCDLESIEPHSRAFVADYFTLEEQRTIADAAPADCPSVIALLWSAKESALKALRIGLRADTRSVVVDILEGLSNASDGWRPLVVRHGAGEFHGWWRCSRHLVRTVVAAPRQRPPTYIGSLM